MYDDIMYIERMIMGIWMNTWMIEYDVSHMILIYTIWYNAYVYTVLYNIHVCMHTDMGVDLEIQVGIVTYKGR